MAPEAKYDQLNNITKVPFSTILLIIKVISTHIPIAGSVTRVVQRELIVDGWQGSDLTELDRSKDT